MAALVQHRLDTCRHELMIGTCSICKRDGQSSVYLTAGGMCFHAGPDCHALLHGQRRVEARGGVTEPIEAVHRGSALLEDRRACPTCRPQ
jgi:hypothetical protein